MLMYFQIKIVLLQAGFYNNIMNIKETYKPKEVNVKKLEIFLNKLDKKNDTSN
jgi:hypothetical protein